MHRVNFVRKPFVVEATEITVDNIEEIAELVGTLKKKDDGTPYIQVDKRLVPHAYRVYPGYWLTQMNDNLRCYSPKVFRSQFVALTDEREAALEVLSKRDIPEDHPSLFMNSQSVEKANVFEQS